LKNSQKIQSFGVQKLESKYKIMIFPKIDNFESKILKIKILKILGIQLKSINSNNFIKYLVLNLTISIKESVLKACSLLDYNFVEIYGS